MSDETPAAPRTDVPAHAVVVGTYTHPDGTIESDHSTGEHVIEGADGMRVVQHPDGSTVLVAADGHWIEWQADGLAVHHGTDGTVTRVTPDGTAEQTRPDGATVTFDAARHWTSVSVPAAGVTVVPSPEGGVVVSTPAGWVGSALPPNVAVGLPGGLPEVWPWLEEGAEGPVEAAWPGHPVALVSERLLYIFESPQRCICLGVADAGEVRLLEGDAVVALIASLRARMRTAWARERVGAGGVSGE